MDGGSVVSFDYTMTISPHYSIQHINVFLSHSAIGLLYYYMIIIFGDYCTIMLLYAYNIIRVLALTTYYIIVLIIILWCY